MRRFVVLIFSLVFATLLCAGQVSVRGVELLEGDHVVQIRFVTSEAIPPIPEVIEKAGNRLELVSPDLAFQLNQPQYLFDSSLIKSVHLSDAGAEIVMHGKAQYRLFSNGDGLFIEFQKGTPAVAQAEKPVTESKPAASKGLGVTVKSSGDDSVQLLLNLPPEIGYEVIPVEQEPCRLAIDLKGVKAGALKENVDLFNVKKVRGGYNTPEVYRVVFDLAYFTPYRVKTVEDGLLVEFYQKGVAAEPVASVPATIHMKNEEMPVVEKPALAAVEPAEAPFFKEEAAMSMPVAQQEETVPAEQVVDQRMVGGNTIQQGEQAYNGAPADFVFKNADLINVLMNLTRIPDFEYNLVVDPGVSGRVSCQLIQVPWDQALDIFLKLNKLDKVVEGNVIRIGRVEELAKEAEQRRKMQEARETDIRLEVLIRPLSYAKAADVKKILDKQLSKRGEIQVDVRSNSLIISEVPDRVKIMDRLIGNLDVANQQVSIEARIVETAHSDYNGFGINWGIGGIMSPRYGNQTSLKFPNSVGLTSGFDNGYAINLPIAGNTAPNTALGLSFGNVAGTFNLDVALMAMEKKGRIHILSSPRTTTQNNMEAEIVNGKKIPIQTQQPNGTYTVTYVNAALELKVKPQITAEGTIITDIDIRNDYPNLGEEVDGRPTISTQSAKNTILIADGGTAVIGGLYKVTNVESKDSVPLISKIPLLGALFRNNSKSVNKQELLIFITPRIVK